MLAQPDRPAGITQCTHINSYNPETDPTLPGWTAPNDLSVPPATLLAKLGDGSAGHEEMSGFARNPKLVKEDIAATAARLEASRDELGEPERLLCAESLKAEANTQFAAGRWCVAVVGYVAGLFFLRRGRSPCPPLVSSALAIGKTAAPEVARGLAEVAAAVRAAEYGGGGGEPEEALRTSLHLNLAAAALKLDEWGVAKAACEAVLAGDAAHPKALFRLAKALEGEGELGRAISVITTLLRHNAQNAEARRLLDALRQRQAEQKGAFKGIFEQ